MHQNLIRQSKETPKTLNVDKRLVWFLQVSAHLKLILLLYMQIGFAGNADAKYISQ